MSNWGTCLNIVSGPVTVKHQLKHLGDVFRKYRLDKVSALGEINSQSKQVTCYKSTNTVRGRVLKSELDSYRQMNSSIHSDSVWCYDRKQAK